VSAPEAPPALGAGTRRALHVVATAGHVDHGKSALILRLTGMDPDRWAEEKRRGLTIDLGFAWTELPSGREVGFVDVPGHERFVGNMLAGVGPVRLVLFVVAADEGWKPQSEEHLQIIDALGVGGAVVALTKRDLVDDLAASRRVAEVRERLAGTGLASAPVIEVSSHTGAGFDELRDALDRMIDEAPPAATDRRPRLFVDRVFTIRGSGTVVTGTLTGGSLEVGGEAELHPSGQRARIRGLQTHKRALARADPVSRVAVNLTGLDRSDSGRGDALTLPGDWRATALFDGSIRTVRGLTHPLTARGAFKLHAGSAERTARLKLHDADGLPPGEQAFVRITLSRPLVLEPGDGFVLREGGRRETVAGGAVLDPFPPSASGNDASQRLRRRIGATPDELAYLVVEDHGLVRRSDVRIASGGSPDAAIARGAVDLGGWLARGGIVDRMTSGLVDGVRTYHDEHPLQPGMPVADARAWIVDLTPRGRERSPDLAHAFVEYAIRIGAVERAGGSLRLPGRQAAASARPAIRALVEAVRAAEPAPPTVKELVLQGHPLEVIRAACSNGELVRISPDLVITPAFLAKAEETVRNIGANRVAVSVSAFREALGTSRKYALPILEHFDKRGVTRRAGDARTVVS
jgi:selenocysteine-specific elongation factor